MDAAVRTRWPAWPFSAAAMAYAALIFYMSSLPAPDFPTDFFPLKDKGVHFLEFAVLAFLIAQAFGRARYKEVVAIAWCVTTLYGVSDELHQAFVPNRCADVSDACADALGALFGAMAGVAWLRRQTRNTQPQK